MNTIRSQYEERFKSVLEPLSLRLNDFIIELFQDIPRIDRISTRPKSVERFIDKSNKKENGKIKYNDPLNQIQDQIGARIVTFYINDVEAISDSVLKYFRPIEFRTVVPDSDYEFTYFGKHFILIIPDDVIHDDESKPPLFFELQIKTLFQHAWSEANHDLGYKPNKKFSSDLKRKLAFASAQAWGADQIFSDLYKQSCIDR